MQPKLTLASTNLLTVFDKVTGGGSAKVELANLDGCFYLVRPTVTVRGAKECLYVGGLAEANQRQPS